MTNVPSAKKIIGQVIFSAKKPKKADFPIEEIEDKVENLPSSDQNELINEATKAALQDDIKEKLKEESEKGKSIMQLVHREALKDAVKELLKEEFTNRRKLHRLLKRSEEVLFRTRNIIPFFTDEIVIEVDKITFIHRPFFFSERVHAVPVKDITDAFIETAPFFGKLHVVDSGFSENEISISWLWKKQAEKARRIITGLMEATKEGIDLKNVDHGELKKHIEELAALHEVNTTVSKI